MRLAWLKEVFERETGRYARTGYRLLLLDGHSSHVTMDLLSIATTTRPYWLYFLLIQPTCFSRLMVGYLGLSSAYSTELSSYLHGSHGILSVNKGDSFLLFRKAWSTTYKKETIRESFEVTVIHPPNATVILSRFHKEASSSDESSTSVLSEMDWLKIESLTRRTAKDESSKEVKKLRRNLHHISAQNSILKAEVQSLKEALKVKKRYQKKSYTFQLNKPEAYHDGAAFWLPKKVRQAQDDEVVRRRQEQQQLQPQEAERSHLKEQARPYKLQQAQEKRVERERLKEVREKERAAKLAEKERQKAACDAGKAIQLSQNGKRKAS
jgi:hypothetical protein